jgi:glycosyltransferase involved in cell wall biosynthesis
MKNKVLSVIIPFLNERYEVENTIKSVREYSTDEVEIILINDASDDNFDYKTVAEKFDVVYIENSKRLGVAASRDLGVEHSQAPYFLLLDAHMRFYNDLWIQRIITELENDKKTLLCCQSKVLGMDSGLLTERKGVENSYGACVELNNGEILTEPYWIMRLPHNVAQSQTIPVVCVLGAGYACSKEYWQYLKGLDGLTYYGSDEPYISMKVWMEGGSCKLLNDIAIGHIYRPDKPPYKTEMKFRLYNRLLIVELLFPEELKKKLLAKVKFFYFPIMAETLFMLYDNRDKITQLKQYYQKIFTRDFSFFEELNNKYGKKCTMKEMLVDNVYDILDCIVKRIIEQPVQDIGIDNGRMGLVIFLFHYARFTQSNSCETKAEIMLTGLLEDIKADTYYGFHTGLSGIGWGIEYLYQQGFIEGDTNEILEDFDKKIMEIDPLRIQNINQNYGLGGIVLYLLARLYTIKKEKKTTPFDSDYLANIYKRINLVIEQRDTICDCIDVFFDFLSYYESKKEINKPQIYDVCNMLNPKNIPLPDLPLGLQGAAGIGLKLIFEQ